MAHDGSTRLIAAPPSIVVSVTGAAYQFLSALPKPNFDNVADTKALWAVNVDTGSGGTDPFGYAGGSVVPAHGGTATTWVASAEASKRVKAHRF